MSLEFVLTLIRRRGRKLAPVQLIANARGHLQVQEAKDEVLHRVVRTAVFERTDGGDPIPLLRDAVLLASKSDWWVLSGVEEIPDGPLNDECVFAQSWRLVPVADEELVAAEMKLSRLVRRLRELGVAVAMRPGGGMVIPGETRPDDGLPINQID